MDIPDLCPELPEDGGPAGGARKQPDDAPDGWADQYVAASAALDLGVPDEEILAQAARAMAPGLIAMQPLWWKLPLNLTTCTSPQECADLIWERYTGIPAGEHNSWDVGNAVHQRHMVGLAFARGWVQSLKYLPQGVLMMVPTTAGVRAVNAFQLRHDRPEFPA